MTAASPPFDVTLGASGDSIARSRFRHLLIVPVVPSVPIFTVLSNIPSAPIGTRRCPEARMHARIKFALPVSALLLLFTVGCTSPGEYLRNGFKVGPNYKKPPAPVAEKWIDEGDKRLNTTSPENIEWWSALNDPVLDNLIKRAARENLTLKEAGQRVLQFRAQRAIAIGSLFPQTQQAGGAFTQNARSLNVLNQSFGEHFFALNDVGFNLAWELDFWGRFRRAVEQSDAQLNATVDNYDDVLVTLIGDVASAYVQIRTLQTRIKIAQDNVVIQRENFGIAEALFKGGKTSKIDVDQSQTNLSQVEAQIPQLEISLRQAQNLLCVLLGIPAQDLSSVLGVGSIPTAAPELVIGIPANLLTRRPDIRRAEREVAAQSAAIGIAEADFYPAIGVTGTLGVQANSFNQLFEGRSLQGSWGPSFQWNILNYGRILNGVRVQDALFEQLVARYQNTVLKANAEVENALVSYLKSHEVVRQLAKSADAAADGVKLASVQYREGKIPFVVVATLQQNLVSQQDQLANAYGQLVLSLIQTYRAIGGGWQIRLQDNPPIENLTPPNEVPKTKLGANITQNVPDGGNNPDFVLTVNRLPDNVVPTPIAPAGNRK
jgi:NodT family efflux transporter outer membrane factor (OMF) lipoprotein